MRKRASLEPHNYNLLTVFAYLLGIGTMLMAASGALGTLLTFLSTTPAEGFNARLDLACWLLFGLGGLLCIAFGSTHNTQTRILFHLRRLSENVEPKKAGKGVDVPAPPPPTA